MNNFGDERDQRQPGVGFRGDLLSTLPHRTLCTTHRWTGDAAISFDAAVHAALSHLTSIQIDASQWEQAGFALRDGGLGCARQSLPQMLLIGLLGW